MYLVAPMSWCASYEAHHRTANKAGASARVVRDLEGARAHLDCACASFLIGNFVHLT